MKNYNELVKRITNMGFIPIYSDERRYSAIFKEIKIFVEVFSDIAITIITNTNYYTYWINKKEDISFVIKQIRLIKKYKKLEPQKFRPAPTARPNDLEITEE